MPVDQRIIDLYDAYTHTPLPRRVFMERLARLAGGTAAAMALLPLLEAGHAHAQMVAPDDGRLAAGPTTYPGPGGEVRAYRARPQRASGSLPGVVVIHENRGLNAHIEDVARRLALQGYQALAPDALSPLGGTPNDADEAREMIYQLDEERTLQLYRAAVTHLDTHADGNGRVGCVGFCWGGSRSNQLAVHANGLDAAVVFYGSSPDADEVPRIDVPLLLHYAGLDSRINAGVPDYEAALQRHGKQYTLHMYEGVNHAFHNDTAAARYDQEAAELAWQRTLAFFERHLKT